VSDAYLNGAKLCEDLVGKLGLTLAAPVNFMASRPYFRFLGGYDTAAERFDFAEGYRNAWKKLNPEETYNGDR